MPTPGKNETQDKFIPRCIPIVIDEGTAKDNNQAVAICNTIWREHQKKNKTESLPVEVMSVGTWNGIKFTLDHLKDMAANFLKLKETIKPPIKLGHTPDKPGAPAYGWVEDLKVVGNKLVAYIQDIPEILMDAIKAKRYRRVSSEVLFEYNYQGKKYGRVFSALALLGAETPAVKNLEDLQAYLSENPDFGTFEKVQAFVAPVDINVDVLENNSKPEKKEDVMSTDFDKKFEDLNKRLNDLVTENASLKADKEALEKEKEEAAKFAATQKQELAKAELKSFCEKLVEEGRMLPSQRDLLVGKEIFSEGNEIVITHEQFKAFCELTGKMLDKTQKAFSDGSGSSTKSDNVSDELHNRTVEFMAKNPKTDYGTALNVVLRGDKDLAARYSTYHSAE